MGIQLPVKQYTDKELKKLRELVAEIKKESDRQIAKWGIQTHSMFEWLTYTTEELGELAEAIADYEYGRHPCTIRIVEEAIQTATLCLKIAEMAIHEQEANHGAGEERGGNEEGQKGGTGDGRRFRQEGTGKS